jgi:hypothetical protein
LDRKFGAIGLTKDIGVVKVAIGDGGDVWERDGGRGWRIRRLPGQQDKFGCREACDAEQSDASSSFGRHDVAVSEVTT